MKEFDIIKRYFYQPDMSVDDVARQGVLLDKGDDCALLKPSLLPLAITTDTLVLGTHFLADIPPHALGHRVLATNLSDLAAMGATPRWFSLALTLDNVDENWLKGFSEGLLQLANATGIYLTGGDTTQGHLSVSITAIGEVDAAKALKRNAANVGDDIYVTGTLGDAAGALAYMLDGKIARTDSDKQYLYDRFNYPTPRLTAGQLLSSVSKSALDISDGLIADLEHICRASHVYADIDVDVIPLSKSLVNEFGYAEALSLALSGGDDYELCFTAPAQAESKVNAIAEQLNLPMTKIGKIIESPVKNGTRNVDSNKVASDRQCVRCFKNRKPFTLATNGYEHFS